MVVPTCSERTNGGSELVRARVCRTNIGLGVGSYAWGIPFNLFLSSCFKSLSTLYFSHRSCGMFLEHFGPKKNKRGYHPQACLVCAVPWKLRVSSRFDFLRIP